MYRNGTLVGMDNKCNLETLRPTLEVLERQYTSKLDSLGQRSPLKRDTGRNVGLSIMGSTPLRGWCRPSSRSRGFSYTLLEAGSLTLSASKAPRDLHPNESQNQEVPKNLLPSLRQRGGGDDTQCVIPAEANRVLCARVVPFPA